MKWYRSVILAKLYSVLLYNYLCRSGEWYWYHNNNNNKVYNFLSPSQITWILFYYSISSYPFSLWKKPKTKYKIAPIVLQNHHISNFWAKYTHFGFAPKKNLIKSFLWDFVSIKSEWIENILLRLSFVWMAGIKSLFNMTFMLK